ncbi:MAG: DUF493 domain-containing protein [Bacteroidetes bacterium]|nr:DUF493 domain-containing protein [Bacteroidota bacterium]
MSENNGKPDPNKIKYPVNYQLKLIMDNAIPVDENIKNISAKLNELQIKFGSFNSRLSAKSTYISFGVMVRIISADQFKILYEELKDVKGLKTAF